tara:strand:- start:2723 stop:2911 length:189 start_codon:yes stop_codon:yes gene_type:complete
MKFELKKDYNRNGKILTAGMILDVTEEGYEWLEKNGYGKEEKKKVKKETKTKKDASDEKQDN